MIGFAEVYAALKNGGTVQRKRWEPATKLRIQDGQLMQSNPNWKGGTNTMLLDWDDMSATDWVIL